MKKIMLFACMAIFLTSCKKDDGNSSTDTSANTAINLSNTAVSGSWRVTLFNDSGNDETAHFSGYNFSFSASNALVTAIKGSSTVTGSWSTGSDNSTVKLILSFPSPADFTDLNDDWDVLERTSSTIRLQSVSGGGGGTDLLTFEKN